MNKERKELKIGDKLWNNGYPMMSYVVLAKIEREKNLQYEIECQECNHSENCRVLITLDDYGDFSYIGMVNECYIEESNTEKHYYFHRNNGNFYLTKKEAEISKLKKYISEYDEKIKKAEDSITYNKKEKAKLQETIKNFEDLLTKKI